jgi:uncharacterized protein (TIGR02300 family)
VANPEWGTKRVCQSCGAKFYDLKREPIVCPKCKTAFDPEAFLKTRRSRTPGGNIDKDQATAAISDVEIETDEAALLDDDEEVAAVAVAEDEEEEDLIEDASELGEDEDDMAEVIENVGEEEDR